MRWLDATPRRAAPRGHKTLISCAACTSSQSPPTAATPFRARGAKCRVLKGLLAAGWLVGVWWCAGRVVVKCNKAPGRTASAKITGPRAGALLRAYGAIGVVPGASWLSEGVCLPLGLVEESVAAAGARARRRVGVAPFRVLFAGLAGPLAGPGTAGARAFGRLVVALDGTTVEVPATAANVAAFGPPPSGGAFPQVRLVTLAGCGSRGIADAAFGPRLRRSEQDLARKIARRGRLGPGMLAVADRAFGGYPVTAALTAAGADVLIRVKSSQWLPPLEVLPDGSYRSVLAEPSAGRRAARARHRGRPLPGPAAGIAVRVIEFDLHAAADGAPPRDEHNLLITTLADPAAAPTAELAACYHQRYEIETSYRKIKTH